MRPSAAKRHQAEEVLEKEGWTVVKIPKDPMQSYIASIGAQPMLTWCEKTLGAGRVEPGHHWLDDNDVWYMFSWYGYLSFHFKHSKDATAFALKWA